MSFSPLDLRHMRRALDLAARGRGAVEPNPLVGCVIADGESVLGEGWHRAFGQPHAEPEALAACTRPPHSATAYVTLEPCCHLAKKTPPCAPALIAAGLARIVIACPDPNPQVCGRGADQLRSAGLQVEMGLLEKESRQLNAPFFATTLHRRPYVTLKWAESADGKVAGPAGQRTWISTPRSRALVHELRGRCDAILAGIGTILHDDPLLTARPRPENHPPLRQPLRVILDAALRIPLTAQLIRTARQSPVLICCAPDALGRADAQALRDAGAEVMGLPESAPGRISLAALLAELHPRRATHLLVEGGPTLAESFIRENLADRAWVFRSPNRIDSPTAPAAPEMPWPAVAETLLDGDRLAEHLNPASQVYFAPEPSADWAMID